MAYRDRYDISFSRPDGGPFTPEQDTILLRGIVDAAKRAGLTIRLLVWEGGEIDEAPIAVQP
jgi:hypothetical protein